MITTKVLRELLATLPDDAKLCACEGEGNTGLHVAHQNQYGWIETGITEAPVQHWEHSLFQLRRKNEP